MKKSGRDRPLFLIRLPCQTEKFVVKYRRGKEISFAHRRSYDLRGTQKHQKSAPSRRADGESFPDRAAVRFRRGDRKIRRVKIRVDPEKSSCGKGGRLPRFHSRRLRYGIRRTPDCRVRGEKRRMQRGETVSEMSAAGGRKTRRGGAEKTSGEKDRIAPARMGGKNGAACVGFFRTRYENALGHLQHPHGEDLFQPAIDQKTGRMPRLHHRARTRAPHQPLARQAFLQLFAL